MTTHADRDMSEHPGLDDPRPGQELRAERERAGISRESMAERLRLAVEQFDALENDDYAELPPPAFVRGYFRAYARELGLDSDSYIAAYNRSGVASRDPEIRSGGGVADDSSGGRGGMIGLLLIALVAAGGIAAWWYQQRTVDGGTENGAVGNVEQERGATDSGDTDSDTQTGTPDTGDAGDGDTDTNDSAAVTEGGSDGATSGEDGTDATSAADDAATVEETASVDVEAAGAAVAATDDEDAAADIDEADAGDSADDGESTGAEAQQPTVATVDRDSLQGGGDGAAGDAGSGDGTEEDAEGDTATSDEDDEAESSADSEPGSTSPAATDSPTSAATDAAGTGPDEITLEFSSRSWLEVYDDRDRELVYTLYFGSDPITLKGWAPFEIFLGNSPAVTVRLNGEEIDKSAFTRSNNTARFVVDASGVRAP